MGGWSALGTAAACLAGALWFLKITADQAAAVRAALDAFEAEERKRFEQRCQEGKEIVAEKVA